MNFKIISLLTIVFLFIGCSNRNNKYVLPTDTLHEQALTQSKRATINDGKQAQVYVTVTYLNQITHPLVKKDDKKEKFIINVYGPNDEYQKLYDEVSVIINNKEQKFLRELKPTDKLLQLIPAVTSWSKYYLFEAPVKERSKNITFEFKTKTNQSKTITFVKDYL